MVNTIASEMNADVEYFYGRLNIISIYMLGKYIGFISMSNKNHTALRAAIKRVLDKC